MMYFIAEVQTQTGVPIPLPSSFRSNPIDLFWTIAIIGFATASIVQWAKEFFRFRRNFQRWKISAWLGQREDLFRFGDRTELKELIVKIRQENEAAKSPPRGAFDQLELLLMGFPPKELRVLWEVRGLWASIYGLPTEQLCGQIAVATEVVVAAPHKYLELFAMLACVGEFPTSKEAVEYVKLAEERPNGSGWLSEERYGELRSQFMIQVQRSIDSLQIFLGERWRRWLTVLCLECSLILSAVILAFLLPNDPAMAQVAFFPGGLITSLFSWFVLSAAGALASPIAHDLMRAVRSLGRS